MCRMTQLAAQKFVTASGKHELKNLKGNVKMGKKEITEVAKIRTGCRRSEDGTGVANVASWNSTQKENLREF